MRLSRPIRLPRGRLPRVEAVVPCYNYGQYLAECVRSVLEQPGVQTGVTIVDDASTDCSVRVAERLVAEDSRVRLIRHERNLGAVATFNDGLSRVDSDYLLLISADDVVAPGAFRRAAALMEARPSVGLVYGHARGFSGKTPTWRPRPYTWTTWRGEEWLRRQFRRGWNSITSPEAFVRTEVQHAVGYYSPELAHTHDVEMWLRIAAVADVGHINGVDQAYYREHGANRSAGFTQGVLSDLDQRWLAYARFLDRAPAGVDVDDLGRILARRSSDEVVARAIAALAGGTEDPSIAQEVGDFARRLDPSVVHRHAWRDLTALRTGTASPEDLPVRVRTLSRDAADRLRWWRWRLVGV